MSVVLQKYAAKIEKCVARKIKNTVLRLSERTINMLYSRCHSLVTLPPYQSITELKQTRYIAV